jgi:CRISPR-associated protein Csy2
MTTVSISRIEVNGANALSGMMAVGYPAMTAFHGFSRALLRGIETAFGSGGKALKGFAVVHHGGRARLYGNFRDRMTEIRYVHDRAANPSKTAHYLNPPSEVQPKCDLVFSLIVEADVDPSAAVALTDRDLLASIVGPRALGGTVRSVGRASLHGSLSDGLKGLPPGLVLIDRTSELQAGEGIDALDAMLDLLGHPYRQTEDGARKYRHLLPTQIGFRGVSEPVVGRPGARDPSVPHVFAEPVIGLVEMRRRHEVVSDAALVAQARWTSHAHEATRLYTLRGA